MRNGRSSILVLGIVGGLSLGGCAAAGGPGGPGPADRPATAGDAEAGRLYREARAELESADYAAAESLAQNVIIGYTETRWMPPALLVAARAAFERNRNDDARARLARYLRLYRASDPGRAPGLVLLARILHLEGQPREAADSLLATPPELGESRAEAHRLGRRVASELGQGELEAVTARWPETHPLQPIFRIELASLLLVEGEERLAQATARRVLGGDPAEPERRRAEALLAGEPTGSRWRPVLGAILPMTGALARYGEAVEEGIRLAVEEYNRRHADSVELMIRDGRDDLSRASRAARELEDRGAVAVVGPLRSQGLERAAGVREDRDLVLVSPTAPEDLSHLRNVYSLWSTSDRAARDARAVARFAVRELQLYRFGVIYPNNQEGRAQLSAFSEEVRRLGGELTASVAYSETETTFRAPLTMLAEGSPQAIFAPAANPKTVIQLAPQFSFYGLRGVQVLGDADWAEPQVLRLVEPRFINGTVLATYLYRASPAVRWPEFVERYERRYRKGLGDNLVPALAYDAAQLILSALPWGAPRRNAVARSIRETRSLPGATGILSVEQGRVSRRSFVLEVRDGELVPAGRGVRTTAMPAGGSGSR